MDTLESLRRKVDGAEDLKSVVRTMKAMAASNIGQYEMAVGSLVDYYHTVALGINAYFRAHPSDAIHHKAYPANDTKKTIGAIVFGSDQGLVGRFNDRLTDFVSHTLHNLPGKKEIWAVGERVQWLLADAGFTPAQLFAVPNSVQAITPLVDQLLMKSMESHEKKKVKEIYIFHNQPKPGSGYMPVCKRLLPLDGKWREMFDGIAWPSNNLPQLAGGTQPTLLALIREYLFVSLFKPCAESLASENASRLDAMQRAEKNIEELLDGLSEQFHRLRQSSIDEELFDVVSGFEALKDDTRHQ